LLELVLFPNVKVDESLPFLNDLVSEALAAGARRYSKPSEDDTDDKALSFKKNDEGFVSYSYCVDYAQWWG
jgi:hypothetical protein